MNIKVNIVSERLVGLLPLLLKDSGVLTIDELKCLQNAKIELMSFFRQAPDQIIGIGTELEYRLKKEKMEGHKTETLLQILDEFMENMWPEFNPEKRRLHFSNYLGRLPKDDVERIIWEILSDRDRTEQVQAAV